MECDNGLKLLCIRPNHLALHLSGRPQYAAERASECAFVKMPHDALPSALLLRDGIHDYFRALWVRQRRISNDN